MLRRIVCASLLASACEALAADPPSSGGLLLVANKADRTLGLVDPVSGRQVATVALSGATAHEVIASPDGRFAYLPIYGDSGVGRPGSDGRSIDVVDVASRRLLATIDLGRAERPHCPLFGSDGRLYVTTELTQTITVVDPRTNAVVDRLPTGQPESHMLALRRDLTRLYTANVGVGSVSVIDVPAKRVVAVVPVSANTQRIALSTDERWLFTADQHAPRLVVIDTTANAVSRFVPLPAVAYGAAPTPDGRQLVAALPKAGLVALVDLRTWAVAKTLEVPKAPQEVLVRPDGAVAYVSCDASAKVAEIDLRRFTLARLIDAGGMVDGLAWARAR